MAKSKPQKSKASICVVEPLEPRVLFSADISVVLPDITADNNVEEVLPSPDLLDYVQVDQPDKFSGEIAFIDQKVPDAERLSEKLRFQGHTVVEVPASASGLDFVTSTLKNFNDVSSVHIISHSDGQRVQLGDTWITSDLLKQNQAQLQLSLIHI